jgi:hypothetical protein
VRPSAENFTLLIHCLALIASVNLTDPRGSYYKICKLVLSEDTILTCHSANLCGKYRRVPCPLPLPSPCLRDHQIQPPPRGGLQGGSHMHETYSLMAAFTFTTRVNKAKCKHDGDLTTLHTTAEIIFLWWILKYRRVLSSPATIVRTVKYPP